MSDLTQAPIVTLSNGLKVANFCDESTMQFSDGNILLAVENDRFEVLSPKHQIIPTAGKKNTIDLHTSYKNDSRIKEEMMALDGRNDIDIVLVPIPVMEALKEWGYDIAKSKARTKCFDKITRTLRIDQFGGGAKKVDEPESIDR